ncbi:MAG: tRNA-(ms[2]io[6]A)-hydroxylase [Pseudomonadales bacterium]
MQANPENFLTCQTPDAWLDVALANIDILLIDHANCEKKAASTAMNLIYRYVDKPAMMMQLSRLAREEMRHFEQVLAILQRRRIEYVHLTPSRYAGELRKGVRTWEPARLVDMLIMGAVVEARSCERFARLTNVIPDEELRTFYGNLAESERRHYIVYMEMAARYAEGPVADRVDDFLSRDRQLIESPDQTFRFHSGIINPSTSSRS